MPEKPKSIKTTIGGQALIEGIMMRGPEKTAIAVRLPDKSIYVEECKTEFIKDRYKIFRLPLLRGIGSLIDSLKIGRKAMMLSVEKAAQAETKSDGTNNGILKKSRFEELIESKLGENVVKLLTGVGSFFGIIFSIFLFFFLPSWIFNITVGRLTFFSGQTFRSIFEGLIKFLIFLTYMLGISKFKDIERVFMYHGAEHKTIFCYENCQDLTVTNVKKFERFHPRCGTSFLVLMLVIGIFFGIFIPFSQPVLRALAKILCLPLFAATGFELIRFCSKHDNFITRALVKPGLLMQRISTKEPDDEIIEVALEAIKRVIPTNGKDQL